MVFHPFHCTKFSHECSPTFKTTLSEGKKNNQKNNHFPPSKNPQSAIKLFKFFSKVSHLNKSLKEFKRKVFTICRFFQVYSSKVTKQELTFLDCINIMLSIFNLIFRVLVIRGARGAHAHPVLEEKGTKFLSIVHPLI